MYIGEPRKVIEVVPTSTPLPEELPDAMPETDPTSEPEPAAPERSRG